MDVVVFVPGTMGTVLKTPGGEEVWPPTALETQFGYKRKAELMREDLAPGAWFDIEFPAETQQHE